MKIDLSFPHDYEIGILKAAPNEDEHSRTPRYDLLIEDCYEHKTGYLVIPNESLPWIGVVSPGAFPSCSYLNAIYSCPNPNQFCVVHNGLALIIKSGGPGRRMRVPCTPVLEVKVLIENQLLLFTDYTGVVAWGKDGLAWLTRPLGFNGVKLAYSDKDYIYGTSFNADHSRPSTPFQIHLRTGEVIGGCMPPDSRIRYSKTSVPVLDPSFVPLRRAFGVA